MKLKTLIIYNSYSGKNKVETQIFDICLELNKYNIDDITVFKPVLKNDIISYLSINKQRFELFVVFGGDGTLHEVVNGIMPDKFKRILYIPCGTVNDFGNYLKLNKKYEKTFELLNTEPFLIDVGKLNGSFFVYTFAIGQFTNISYGKYNRKFKRFLGKIYYYMKGFGELFSYEKIEVENVGDYFIVLVLNAFRIASFKIRRPNKLNDGLFNVVLFKNTTFFNFINLVLFLLFGLLMDATKYTKCSELHFSTKRKHYFNLDGELGGYDNEFHLKVEEKALLIYIPNKSKKYF